MGSTSALGGWLPHTFGRWDRHPWGYDMVRFIYNPKTAFELFNELQTYRVMCLEHNSAQNGELLKDYTQRALGIREDYPELPEVPVPHNPQGISEQDYIHLEQWFLTAMKVIRPAPKQADVSGCARTPAQLYEEMKQYPIDLLKSRYGNDSFDKATGVPDFPIPVPNDSDVFHFRQEAIALRARYAAAGLSLPPVPQGHLDIMQWLLDASASVKADENDVSAGRQTRSPAELNGQERPDAEANGKAPYVEIDLAGRTLTVGERKITPTNKIWEFLKELADAKRYNRPDPKPAERKNAVDMLRRTVGKESLGFIIESTISGYRLASGVKLSGGGQMGIRGTR